MQRTTARRNATAKTQCKLVADTRERHVMRHDVEFDAVNYEISQITTGDYAILTPGGRIMAVIERKSLDDYGASLKDGRHHNRHKMMDLRTRVGCSVVYIVEGPLFPNPTDCFAGIPYHAIESSIFHLMVRDNITVMRARDTLDTARLLARFVRSMDSLMASGYHPAGIEQALDGPVGDAVIAPADGAVVMPAVDAVVMPAGDGAVVMPADGAVPVGVIGGAPMDLLRAKHSKSEHEVVREMWAVFAGITTESADDFISRWSIGEIVSSAISAAAISACKHTNGRKVSKRVVGALTNINARTAERLLATIPGVSSDTAQRLLVGVSLGDLLSRGAAGIDIISVAKPGGKPRKLGPKLAERICRHFAYTRRPEVPR